MSKTTSPDFRKFAQTYGLAPERARQLLVGAGVLATLSSRPGAFDHQAVGAKLGLETKQRAEERAQAVFPTMNK